MNKVQQAISTLGWVFFGTIYAGVLFFFIWLIFIKFDAAAGWSGISLAAQLAYVALAVGLVVFYTIMMLFAEMGIEIAWIGFCKKFLAKRAQIKKLKEELYEKPVHILDEAFTEEPFKGFA